MDRGTVLPDPLAGLAPDERRRLVRKELHLVRHLDRMMRRGEL
ncbi:hypothetical protein SK571_41800 [Lentzea sp. BCCO 10_0798]|uniref:Uncharacterized protein n=1 Tax=Lentzea kristufekii TaxID=3095430 RepID=A0ABU4U7K6_9PSEU|nr:hypothetical protein [Lentzea sp. BCCO 10_0798]MDX8055951.1 hypothetical protein [Lentzea sp. BCCO 10_0798]